LSIVNCFWLLIPIFLWNAILTPRLTHAGFQSDADVPSWILMLENVLRIAVFALPLLLPLQWNDQREKIGIIVYVAGTLIYFCSWIPLVYFPEARWSTSALVFLAPHFT
jgi:hypothetical protein